MKKRFGSIDQAVEWLMAHKVIVDSSSIQLSRRLKYGMRVWGAIDYLLNNVKGGLFVSWIR